MADKILIVDDDVQTLRVVGLMLERQGYQILAASDGEQALQIAAAQQPDVILLDIMMPDLDGFEVTRRLRRNPATASIPILVFTAKVEVEDKVTGYEAGADDYLTKPIHPAELTAHLRALLARHRRDTGSLRERGYTIGVLAARGGLGVSTTALNLAIAFHQKTKAEVIAAELRPGMGTWGPELGNQLTSGLSNLLRLRPMDVCAATVENELARMPYGIRLLLASPDPKEAELILNTDQLVSVAEQVGLLAKLALLDIGACFLPGFERMLNHCNEVIVVTEPFPVTVQRTRLLIDMLARRGFGRSKTLTVVSVNRTRADVQLPITQMQETLGLPIAQVFPPAPEAAYQASTRNVPMIQAQIGGVVGYQFNALAERLMQRVPV